MGHTRPDTLRILAIRVEFQEDNNNLTTGNGKFDLSPADGQLIDPPPHNLRYFEQQLAALSQYYATVSHGKLILLADVFPREDNGAYTVSEQMNFYVPPNNETLLDERLSRLLSEGFQAADATDNIEFSEYDVFLIFHAGVGADFSFDFDPTPQDVPSVFLSFETLKKSIGNDDPTFSGIAVNEGRFFIREGTLLPETQTQEGIELGLLGTMAIMMGNQLGAPILFSPDTGLPGIGIFGLMDQGSGNFFGLLPAEPSAWTKIFLGWEIPIEITDGSDLRVAAARADNPDKIYKIPINSHEYFLLENRDRDLNKDGIAVAATGDGARVEFRWDENGQQVLLEQPGVVTRVSDYDFGIPGSGILIWHIDERIIAANLESNRVNADPLNRGVDLEEADGAQDIGQVYGILDPGAGSENGVVEDMYWASNPINMLVNDSSDVVAFATETRPNSKSNAGANSDVAIFGFSERDSVMTFSVRKVITQKGFPQYTGAQLQDSNSPLFLDFDGDGIQELVASSSASGDIFAWNLDATKVIPNSDVVFLPTLNGDMQSVPAARFANLAGTRLFPPAAVQLGAASALVAASDEAVAVYLAEDLDNNGRADSLFVYHSAREISTAPMVLASDLGGGFTLALGSASGDLITLDQGGNQNILGVSAAGAVVGLARLDPQRFAYSSKGGEIGLASTATGMVWQRNVGTGVSNAPIIADLDQDGSTEIVSLTDEGELHVFSPEGNDVSGFPRITSARNPSWMAAGDIDGDRFIDLVMISENQIYALNHTGALKNNFPVTLDASALVNRSSPVLADMNSDGIADIIVGARENQVTAFTFSGKVVAGFPLSTGQAVHSTPFTTDADGDGDVEMCAVAEDGFVYVWNLTASFSASASSWPGLFGGVAHSNANLQFQVPPPASGQLMPGNLVYNYPNPTESNRTTIRYTLNAAADVRIKIYDLVGEYVDELVGPGFARTENEVDWRLENIESGVYLARVEAKSTSQTDVAILKIAVVK